MTQTDPPPAPDEVFRTPRLRVRHWQPADEAALMAIYGDAAVVRWVDDGQPLSPEEAGRWMQVTRANYAARGYGMYAIEGLSRPGVIGFGGLVHPGQQVEAEVKYAFLPEVWGQGLATEFVGALISHARHRHGLTRIIATVAQPNHASRGVLGKCSFHHVGSTAEDDGSITEVFAWQA